jgi:hypothetical protein
LATLLSDREDFCGDGSHLCHFLRQTSPKMESVLLQGCLLESFYVRSKQRQTHTAFLRICRVLKEVFRWFGHGMACQSHDIFAFLPWGDRSLPSGAVLWLGAALPGITHLRHQDMLSSPLPHLPVPQLKKEFFCRLWIQSALDAVRGRHGNKALYRCCHFLNSLHSMCTPFYV